MSEKETIDEYAVRMGAYLKARQDYPFEELYARYAGKVFAWGPDGKTIIASAEDYEALENQVLAAGYDPSRCIFDAVDYDLL